MFSFSNPGSTTVSSAFGTSTSKSSNPGKVGTTGFSSCLLSFSGSSSGKGFFLGLPLFPFGFGLGSTGYFLGLPLPFLTGSSCKVSSFTSSVLAIGCS